MYELIKEFIKPELIILVPVIYIIGRGLKKSSLVHDNIIPLLLGGVSVILSALWTFATSCCTDIRTVLLGIFTSVTQGVLIAGASVYIHQLVKQSGESNKTDKK